MQRFVSPDVSTGDARVPAVTDVGLLSVRGELKAGFPPAVTFSPGAGASGVEEFPRIRVRFDREMDLATLDLQVVRGISRRQAGIAGSTLVRFLEGATEIETIPASPLRNGEFYTVFIPKDSRDVEGNAIRDVDSSSRFTVRDAPTELGGA